MNPSKHAAWRWLLVALLPAALARADVLHLDSGGRIEGRIISRDASTVVIELGAGTMELPADSIRRIEEGETVLDDYDRRRAALPDGDLDGWLALGRWAAANDLDHRARSAFEHVLARDPANAAANTALGRVEVDGRWLSRDDAYQAQGYVKFEGEWMRPEEVEAVERQRSERAAADLAREQAREAEARARAAEARAREAEADAEAQWAAADDAEVYYWNAWPYRPPHHPVRPPRPMPEPEPEPLRPIRVPFKR